MGGKRAMWTMAIHPVYIQMQKETTLQQSCLPVKVAALLTPSQEGKDWGDAGFCDASRCQRLTHNLLLFIPWCVCKHQCSCPVQSSKSDCTVIESVSRLWHSGTGKGVIIEKRMKSKHKCRTTSQMTHGSWIYKLKRWHFEGPWIKTSQLKRSVCLRDSLLKNWAVRTQKVPSFSFFWRKLRIRSFGLPAAEC